MFGEGNDTPIQYSCLENPMDGGAWQAAVHRVTKSRTRLSDFTFTFHFHALEKEMATHSSVLAWRIPGTGEPGGCHLWGHTESDTTEVTQQQQQDGLELCDILSALKLFFIDRYFVTPIYWLLLPRKYDFGLLQGSKEAFVFCFVLLLLLLFIKY